MFVNKSAITIFGILFLLVTSLFLLGANHQQKVEWEYATYYHAVQTWLSLQIRMTTYEVGKPTGNVSVTEKVDFKTRPFKYESDVNGVKRSIKLGEIDHHDLFLKELAGTLLYNKLVRNSDWHKIPIHDTDDVQVLEIMGAKGWELIQQERVTPNEENDVNGIRFYFKRRKS